MMTTSLREKRRLVCALMRRLPVICMLILIGLSRDVLGQSSEGGSISGRITDSWEGNPVPAVVVSVRGTTLAANSDAEGRYQVSGVPAGTYTLVLTKPGFQRVLVPDVRVAAGINSQADAKMGPTFFELSPFQALAEPIPDQKVEITKMRQKEIVLSESMTADDISRLGAGDATDVAKRITGVTIQEGKFIVVRGLSDRYTSASLNGAVIPSADAEKQAAQLDLIPADMIQRLDVRKTFTPDMPGGFAGGSVNIITKSFPDAFTFNFSVGASYNVNSNLKDDFAGSIRGSDDWFATDDGTRQIPADLVSLYDAIEASGGSVTVIFRGRPFTQRGITRGYIQNLDNGGNLNLVWNALIGEDGEVRLARILNAVEPLRDFGPVESSSPLNSNWKLSFGDKYKILGRDSGFFAGINYNRNWQMYQEREAQRFTARASAAGDPLLDRDQHIFVTNGVTSVTWAANFTTGIKPSDNHELGFNFSRVQAADDTRSSLYYDVHQANIEQREYQSQYTERSLQNFQILGKHEFPDLADLRFEWITSIADVSQEDPNVAIAQVRIDPIDGEFRTLSNTEPESPTRLWRDIKENNFNNRVDFDQPYQLREREGTISFGAYQSLSTREYREDGFRLENDPSIVDDAAGEFGVNDVNLGISSIAASDYDGERTIEAVYGMAELPVNDWWQLIGGARLETTDISIVVRNKEGLSPPPSNTAQKDLLPALGAVFTPTKKHKITAHWSRTIARPTFREIAPIEITDFENLQFIRGEPSLKLSAAENFDLRFEYFPQDGEVISLGGFYKIIENPIELQQENSDFPNFRFFNTEKATVIGAEFEYRRGLDVLHDSLSNYSFGANFAYIFSEVENTPAIRNTKAAFDQQFRPLFDQSPMVVNGDLSYENEKLGLQWTAAFNYYARRLVAVSITGPDIYEDPVPSFDFSISKQFGYKRRWKLKFSANNLLDPEIERSIDRDYAHTVTGGNATYFDSYRRGRTFGMSLAYKF